MCIMKTNIFNFILIGTLLMTGVVSAFEEPSAGFPKGEANAPVHIGSVQQAKSGEFWSRIMKSGLSIVLPSSADVVAGFFAADEALVSPQGFFTRILLPGNKSFLRVGTITNGLYQSPASQIAPFMVDLSGRGTQGSNTSRDTLAIMADSAVCTPHVNFITNTPAFKLVSNVNNGGSADILARQIQLSGGNPAPGKVLVSFDGQGNAVWGTPKMVKNGNNWVLSFDYSESPVFVGQNICQAPDVCPNIPGLQTTVPAGYSLQNGQCIQDPVDVCPNIDGLQTTVPSGYILQNGLCVREPKGYWEPVTQNLKNINWSTGPNLVYAPKNFQECAEYLKSVGGYDHPLRVSRYTNNYANIGTLSKNMNSRELMLPLGGGNTIATNNIVTSSTSTLNNSPEGFCLYRAQVVYTPGDPAKPNNPIPVNGIWDSAVPTVDFNSYWKVECLVLPVGEKPPTNEKWSDTTWWIKNTNQPNKIKQWRPSISCTPIDKVQGGFCSGNPPLMNPSMCAITPRENPYQLQYYREE